MTTQLKAWRSAILHTIAEMKSGLKRHMSILKMVF